MWIQATFCELATLSQGSGLEGSTLTSFPFQDVQTTRMIGKSITSIGVSVLQHGMLILSVVRFVDRDMVMRYHWGLAVGHAYAHEKGDTVSMDVHTEEREPGIHPEVEEPDDLDLQNSEGQDDAAEHTLRNRDDDAWDDSGESGGDDEPDQLVISDVEEDVSGDEFVFLTSRDRCFL